MRHWVWFVIEHVCACECVRVSVCVRVCVLWNTSEDREAGESIRLLAEGEA